MAAIVRRDKYTPRSKQVNYYSDFTNNLDVFAGSKDVVALTDTDSVRNALKNLVLTNRTERFFNPEYGCDVRKLLFEPVEPATEAAIQKLITAAVENFEPRVKLLNVVVSGQLELNAYTITIVFATINSVEPEKLDLILTRVR